MKKIIFSLVTLLCSAHSFSNEIITDSKGQKIELRDDYTWRYANKPLAVESSDQSLVFSKSGTVLIDAKDGNNNNVSIDAFLDFDKNTNVSIKRHELETLVLISTLEIKKHLKNEYSYQPKMVLVYLKDSKLEISIKYTATNSYGAETVSYGRSNFQLNEKGKYQLQPGQ